MSNFLYESSYQMSSSILALDWKPNMFPFAQ
jgi:hypothetical protein